VIVTDRFDVIVIGAELREKFFPQADPIGKTIKIAGRPMRVIGVEQKRGSMFGQSLDNLAYIPLTTYGRMFSPGDDEARQRYAVLGASVTRMLGGNPGAMIHQTLLIRGIPFEIIGVLSEKGAAGGFGNPDEQILIPLQTAKYRIFGSDRLRTLSVEVADGVPIQQGMVDL
jgi:ABC-type antimicrobial peptide transport system permease subunit